MPFGMRTEHSAPSAGRLGEGKREHPCHSYQEGDTDCATPSGTGVTTEKGEAETVWSPRQVRVLIRGARASLYPAGDGPAAPRVGGCCGGTRGAVSPGRPGARPYPSLCFLLSAPVASAWTCFLCKAVPSPTPCDFCSFPVCPLLAPPLGL